MIGAMTTRRGLFVAPFDALADPRVVGDLAATAEAAGWDGFFVWDHLQYGERVTAIADVWTCCAAVAMRTEKLLFGPMVTPLARRRPQVLARQAASLAVLSGGRFVLGLGLGDDWVGEFSAFGDEPDPKLRGRMLDEGLEVLTALLSGGPVDHDGAHYAVREVRFRVGQAGFRTRSIVVVTTILDPAQASIIVAGDAKSFAAQLKAKRPDLEVIPVSELDLDSPTLRKPGK